MKNNTHETKEYLMQALRSLPNDFALTEVRFHLKNALNKLESVEAKRLKRETQQPGNNWVVLNGELMHPEVAKKVVSQLDHMINSERLKLEEIKKKKELTNGEEDIQALFG